MFASTYDLEMAVHTETLIWLFPIVFMLHDFEEIILGEPWLTNNAEAIRSRIGGRLPRFFVRRIESVLRKKTSELALPILLIFAMASLSAYLAAEQGAKGLFLLASAAFFVHGFGHMGQAMVLNRYVPGAMTSLVLIVPYSLLLFRRLLDEGVLTRGELAGLFAGGAILVIPFILLMHGLGDFCYPPLVKVVQQTSGAPTGDNDCR